MASSMCEKAARLSVFSLPHSLGGKTFRCAGKNLIVPNDTAKLSYLSDDGTCLTLWRHTNRSPTLNPNLYSHSFEGTNIVLLCHGGYFAGGVFEGSKCMTHKTFHRYVTRKKQGKRQMNYDKHGGGASSMGSQMRRWNEEKHRDDVANLIEEWRDYFDRASYIFLHCPGDNKRLFFASDGPSLRSFEERVRSVSMNTSRPKYAEVTRVWEDLCAISMSHVDPLDVQRYLPVCETPEVENVSTFDPFDDAQSRPIVYPRPRLMRRHGKEEEREDSFSFRGKEEDEEREVERENV